MLSNSFYAVSHNNRYTLLTENISLRFVPQRVLVPFVQFFLRRVQYSILLLLDVIVIH